MVRDERGNQGGDHLYELFVESHLLLNHMNNNDKDFGNIMRVLGIGLHWDQIGYQLQKLVLKSVLVLKINV